VNSPLLLIAVSGLIDFAEFMHFCTNGGSSGDGEDENSEMAPEVAKRLEEEEKVMANNIPPHHFGIRSMTRN
jgi:hypothetical protein